MSWKPKNVIIIMTVGPISERRWSAKAVLVAVQGVFQLV